MVSPDHYDRHSSAEPGQGRRDVKPAPPDHPGVGEPEIEQVAVDEKAVPQVGDRFQERQERLLDGGRRHAEMGIGDDDQRMAQHGAKDEPLRPAWQPAPRACDSAKPPSVTNPERPA